MLTKPEQFFVRSGRSKKTDPEIWNTGTKIHYDRRFKNLGEKVKSFATYFDKINFISKYLILLGDKVALINSIQANYSKLKEGDWERFDQ